MDRRIFGNFIEHLGRCVYGGLFEPDHPTATPEGFRGDVLELVRRVHEELPVVEVPVTEEVTEEAPVVEVTDSEETVTAPAGLSRNRNVVSARVAVVVLPTWLHTMEPMR